MKAGEDPVQDSTAHDAPRWTASGVETYVIQCNLCFKWRVVPSKERYEAIREHVLENPFVCVHAQEWRPNTSCDDPADLDDDEPTVLWAIDRHNLPRTPEGFYRKVVLRSEGASQSKFADVYYTTPCGKTLRSGVQAQKYLDEHPELEVQISQFSFTSPKGRNDSQLRPSSSTKRPSKIETPPSKKLKVNSAVKPTGQGQLSLPQASHGKAPHPKMMHDSASKLHDADHDKPSKVGKFHVTKGAPNLMAVKKRQSMAP